MIIRRDADTLLFISQPDHARLAAAVIVAWRGGGLPMNPRRDAVVLATREHDNGWIEEDAETHTAPSGSPLDFIDVPAAVKHRIWPRAVGRLAADHPYEAALVAQHALTVNGDHRQEPTWRSFFETLDIQRDALLERCDATASATLAADYAFVNMGDLLSLIFCNGWREPFVRFDHRFRFEGSTLRIAPDPFDGVRLPLRVLARRLPARAFASNADLRAALDDGAVEFLEGEAVGGPP
jgi:hypothetical protein